MHAAPMQSETKRVEELERMLHEAREHAHAEELDDAQELQRQLGKPIVYGQVIQLRHLLTEMWLSASSTDAAELDAMNLNVSLVADSSRRTLPDAGARARSA